MPLRSYSSAQIERRGEEIYERGIRARVEPEHRGKFLAVDIETGDYEIDRDELAALDRLRSRHAEGARHLIRIGYPAAVELGGHFAADER